MNEPQKPWRPGRRAESEPPTPKRLNRLVGVGAALERALEPAFKKRGFATRDLVTHWGAIVPPPYDKVTVPDQLKWPRGAAAEGATLYLRHAPGYALALGHDGGTIATAINRYFGYFLVRAVKLSPAPFHPPRLRPPRPPVTPEVAQRVAQTLDGVGDPALKQALKGLGEAILTRGAR